MTTVAKTCAPLDTIDADLTAACLHRHETWRQLAIKDSLANRDGYDQACAAVDGLLDMRHQMMTAERIVSA